MRQSLIEKIILNEESFELSAKQERFVKNLTSDLRKGLTKFLKSIGWDDEEINDWSRVDTEVRPHYYDDGDDALFIEVGAELGYRRLSELADELTKVLAKYYDWYFDVYDSGILVTAIPIQDMK